MFDAGLTEKLAALAEEPIEDPPLLTVNQLIVLPAEVALMLILDPGQIEVAVFGVTPVGAAGKLLTVTATPALAVQVLLLVTVTL